MARIAIGGFLHETNCFVPVHTDFQYFADGGEMPPLAHGAEIFEKAADNSFGMSGFLETISASHELVPLVWGHGGAGGYITDDAFERIVGEMIGRLSEAMPVDAVYLDLHGAMCTLTYEDGEGEMLRRVRACVGPDIPVVISLDYHVNITRQMVDLTDGMAIYLTYPHVDRDGTGSRSAKILERVLLDGQPTARAFRKTDFLIPLNFQCTMVEPSKGIVGASVAGEGGAVLNLSYGAGFPPSDLAECGPAVVSHGYDQTAVDAAADKLFHMVNELEPAFAEELLSPDAAVQQAMEIAKTASKPVVLADTQDNPGCGGTGDTTGLLEAMVRNQAEGAVMCVMADPAAAEAAHAAGEGAEITVDLGGKHGPEGVGPFHGTFTVTRLSDGQFTATGPCIGGRRINIGPTALLTIGGVSVVTASKRMQAYDQDIFRHIGIEPSEQKIVALKSTCHFRADFQPIAERVIVVLAPGAHIVDTTQYPFKYLREGVRLEPMGPEFRR